MGRAKPVRLTATKQFYLREGDFTLLDEHEHISKRKSTTKLLKDVYKIKQGQTFPFMLTDKVIKDLVNQGVLKMPESKYVIMFKIKENFSDLGSRYTAGKYYMLKEIEFNLLDENKVEEVDRLRI